MLYFVSFADAGADEATAREAVGLALEQIEAEMQPPLPGRAGGFDCTRLAALIPRILTRERFLGDWVDARSGQNLVFNGDYRLSDGRTLHRPSYEALQRTHEQGAAFAGSGFCSPTGDGQFGYAFAQPPYGLRADFAAIQKAFDAVCAVVLPSWTDCSFLDWDVSGHPGIFPDLFDAGMEWWGVFQFTVHVPAERRLTVIVGSASD